MEAKNETLTTLTSHPPSGVHSTVLSRHSVTLAVMATIVVTPGGIWQNLQNLQNLSEASYDTLNAFPI